MSTFLPSSDDVCSLPEDWPQVERAVVVAPEAASDVLVQIACARLTRLTSHLEELACMSADSAAARLAEFVWPMLDETRKLLAAAMEHDRPRETRQQAGAEAEVPR